MKIKISFIATIFCFVLVNAQEKVTICWDASLSMKDRNIQNENEFLEDYFSKKQNIEVNLLIFNNQVTKNNSYNIQSGDWSIIKKDLANVNYDGATSYRLLANQIKGGDVLLFTDGNQNIYFERPKFTGNVSVINSKHEYNRVNLKLITVINSGKFINLSDHKINGAPEKQSYFGKIYYENALLKVVTISIKGNNVNAQSKSDGTYHIEASEGDTLVFSANDTKSKEIELGENRNINMWLEANGIRLDEVIVDAKIENEQPQKEVTTSYGKKSEETVGYAVQSISDDDISEINTDLSNAVQGKFSGVRYGQNDDLSQIIIRGGGNSMLSNIYGLIVLDGVPLPRSDSSGGTRGVVRTNFIDPNNIADITILKGLAATNRYGSLGNNGVILITTKTATYAGSNKKIDQALLTNNFYDGKIKVNKKLFLTPYLKELKKGKNVAEAYEIYLNQREKYWSIPEYYIDVFDFFIGSSKQLAYQILSNILEKENPSVKELRGLMFKAKQHGNYQMVLEAANKALELYPIQIQSYVDVALAQKNVGNYQSALNMLISIVEGSINPELNFSGIKKIVNNEIRNIIFKERTALDLSHVDAKYLKNMKYDARLVFEWNNEDAEFELQFVNPQKRFFKWEHTDSKNRDRIRDELNNGYCKEEFIISGEEKGEWIINVNHLGNRNTNNVASTFLKCTVQYNFGKTNQKTEEHMVRLHEVGSEELLVKLNIQ